MFPCRASKRKNRQAHIVRYLSYLLISLTYLFHAVSNKTIHFVDDFGVSLPRGLRETILTHIVVEVSCKMCVLHLCHARSIIKLIYIGTNACIFFVISQVNIYEFVQTNPLLSMLSILCMFYQMKKGLAIAYVPNEERYEISKRLLSSIPEGAIVLCRNGIIWYANKFVKNLLYSESLQVKRFSIKDFDDIYLSNPSIQKFVAKKATRSAKSDDLEQCGDFCATKEKLKEKLHEFDHLASLIDLLVHEPKYVQVLKRFAITFKAEHRNRDSRDEPLALEVLINVFETDKKQDYFIILFKDRSEYHKIISLEKENEIYRNNLIATFSHELRTPLNGNLAFVEQALDSPYVPMQVKEDLLKPALTSGKFLLSIVDDILDYSQVILGKLELKVTSGSLVSTVEQSLAIFKEKLNQKRLKVSLNIHHSVASVIYTDHRRVSQVLINLLSNAVKFTKKGSIEVRLRSVSEQNVRLSVVDSGPGMDDNIQAKLRANMASGQIKEKIDKNSVGIGFGLYISNALACLVNSDKSRGVQFTSREGEGSEFYFEVQSCNTATTRRCDDMDEGGHHNTVPVKDYILSTRWTDEACSPVTARSLSLTPSLSMNQTEMQSQSQPQVLIVDDEPFNVMVIENFCKTYGVRTERAFDGKEALERIKTHTINGQSSFKLIFMDVNMPIMDGYETVKAIRCMESNNEIEKIPVVGVTAYVAQDMIKRCYEYGMDDVMNKPVSKEMIISTLKRYKL